jgi:hypothetical protein
MGAANALGVPGTPSFVLGKTVGDIVDSFGEITAVGVSFGHHLSFKALSYPLV